MPKSDMLFPKEPKKKKTPQIKKRRVDNSMEVREMFDNKCMNYLFAHREHRPAVDCCHIKPKRPHAPWLDIPENCVLLCRSCHDKFDGRTPVPGMTHKEYQIFVIQQQKHKPNYIHDLANNYLTGWITEQEYENNLKQIYYQRIGETK